MVGRNQKSFCTQKFKTLLLTASVSTGIEYIMLLSDTIIVGNIFGEAAIAASNMVVPLFSFVVFVSTLISCGTSALYSYKIGEFKKDEADRLFGQGVLVAVLSGGVLFLLAAFGGNAYFGFMDSSQAVEVYAREYYQYYRFVVLLYPIYAFLIDMVYADGDELISNLSYIFQVGVNIPASVILCKKIGVGGASLGTLIGTVLSMVILLLHFLRKQNSMKFVPHISAKDMVCVARHGLLDSSIYLFWGIAFFVANRFVIARFGAYYLPILSVIISVIEMTIVFDGVGQAMTPLVTVYRGEKNTTGIRKVMRLAGKAAALEGVAASFLLFFFGKYAARLLGVTDPAMQELCATAIRFVCPFLICSSVLFLLTSYYLLMEKHTLALLITAVKDCFTVVCLMVLGGVLFGLNGVWAGLGLAPLFSAAMTYGIVCARYGRGIFPLLLPKGEYEIEDFDLLLTEQNIMKLRDAVEKVLREKQIDQRTISRIMLLTEELEMLVMSKNPGRKIMAECTLMIGADIQLIFRDNGVLFDITDEDSAISSMRSYVVARMMIYQKRKRHLVTTSYNRNVFHFDKEKVDV